MQRATALGGSRSQIESAVFVQFNGLPRREQAARHMGLEMIDETMGGIALVDRHFRELTETAPEAQDASTPSSWAREKEGWQACCKGATGN